MALAIPKTEILIFYGERRLQDLQLDFLSNTINSNKKIKYLGAYFGKNTNMTKHISCVVGEAERSIEALSKIILKVDNRLEWGQKKVNIEIASSYIAVPAPAT